MLCFIRPLHVAALGLLLALCAFVCADVCVAQTGVSARESTRPTTLDPAQRLRQHLDQFYTWGDVVERWSAHVHGRWMTYRPNPARSGEFWGKIEYDRGRFRLTIDRTRGATEPSTHWTRAITLLCQQAGLLPTGFPLPRGRVVERTPNRFAVTADGRAVADFRFRHGRLEHFTSGGLEFTVGAHWIGKDHLKLRSFTARRPGSTTPVVRVRYGYRRFVGNYVPRAITEERTGASLNLLFDQHYLELAPTRPRASANAEPSQSGKSAQVEPRGRAEYTGPDGH